MCVWLEEKKSVVYLEGWKTTFSSGCTSEKDQGLISKVKDEIKLTACTLMIPKGSEQNLYVCIPQQQASCDVNRDIYSVCVTSSFMTFAHLFEASIEQH